MIHFPCLVTTPGSGSLRNSPSRKLSLENAPSGGGALAQAMTQLDADLRIMLKEKRMRNESIISAVYADGAQERRGDLLSDGACHRSESAVVGRLGVGGLPSPTKPVAEGALGGITELIGGGPRWGASEGGLDGLGWVRDLVAFPERAMTTVTGDSPPEDNR